MSSMHARITVIIMSINLLITTKNQVWFSEKPIVPISSHRQNAANSGECD